MVLIFGGQAQYLEQVLREAHAHPTVSGIVIWSAWKPGGCYRMCLTDNNFRNLATGNVVDKLLREWGGLKANEVEGMTDANGFFESSLFHGDYNVKISHPDGVINSPLTASPNVASTDAVQETTLLLQVAA